MTRMNDLLLLCTIMCLSLLLLPLSSSDAFAPRTTMTAHRLALSSSASSKLVVARHDNSLTDDVDLTWMDDEDDENQDDDADAEPKKATSTAQPNNNKKSSSSSSPSTARWNKLNKRIKERIVQEGQERAIANKKKREPAQDKKRRMMMYFKEKQREKKVSSKVQRTLPFDARTPLSVLIPGMNVTGTVISLAKYGAYIDVGTECDGLLHISQISNEFFVEHPKQVLTPGEQVTVKIRSLNPERKKLHLTMLPDDVVQLELEKAAERNNDNDDNNNYSSRIPLDDILIDDEMWGELRRVTDYGAYVEVGAVVDGWLHFMDHPAFQWDKNGAHPSTFMQVGDRVRVWVSDVDHAQQRLKLTANRPTHLPGPRRAL